MVAITNPARGRRFSLRGLAERLTGLRQGAVPVLPADVDAAVVEAALAEYAEAKAIADPAKKRVEAARALLDGVPAGQYGPWRLKWGKARRIMDQPSARALLDALGERVPMTTTSAVIKVERAA